MLSYRNLGDVERSLHRLATTGLIWIPCSRCNMQWAKWLAFQSKTHQ
jgi:hypothetical protein